MYLFLIFSTHSAQPNQIVSVMRETETKTERQTERERETERNRERGVTWRSQNRERERGEGGRERAREGAMFTLALTFSKLAGLMREKHMRNTS